MQFSTDPLAAAAALPNLVGTGTGPGLPSMGVQGATPAPFVDLLTDAIGNVNQLEDQARITVDSSDGRDGCRCASGNDRHRKGKHGIRIGIGGAQQSGPGLSVGDWNAS